MAIWHVELLGSLQAVHIDGTVVSHFRTSRASLLLAILALQPGKPYSREWLCEMLWPEGDPVRQRERLRYELTVLRRVLGEEAIVTDGNQEVRLHPTLKSDVQQFDAAFAQASRTHTIQERITLLQQAVTLYKGDFIPGRYLPEGSPPEYDWIEQNRYRLQSAFGKVVVKLLADRESLGQWDDALHLRQEATERFPEIVLPASARETTARIGTPLETTSFVGRKTEWDTLTNWIRQPFDQDDRLRTLLGSGGIGKTRLAREVTRAHHSVFVSLADHDCAERLWEELHQSLHLPNRPGLYLREQVIAALRVQEYNLLTLDNLEHLLPDLAPLVEDLLTSCPRLRLLGTSRRPIGIVAERVMPVFPLPTEDGMMLFLDRARVVRRDFARTPQGQETVRSISRLLEGVPLALELAATRALILGPNQMLEQLSHRLRFLVHPPQSAPDAGERHRSLRTALAWSFDLLSPSARTALTRLSIFRGGFSLVAGIALCGDADPPLVDTLQELCLHSLIRLQPTTSNEEAEANEEVRYELMTAVREFATEQWGETDRYAGERRHAEYFLNYSAEIDRAARFWRWQFLRQHFVPDVQNFRAAAAYAARTDDVALAWGLLETTVVPFFELGYWTEVDDLLQRMENVAGLDTRRLGRYLGLCGALARRRGMEEVARQLWERRRQLCTESYQEALTVEDDSFRTAAADQIADVLLDLAGQSIDLQEWERAEILLKETDKVMESIPVPNREIPRWALRARLCQASGDFKAARMALDCAQQHRRALSSDGLLLYLALHALPIYRAQKDSDAARPLLWQSLQVAFVNTHPFILARFMTELGFYLEGYYYSLPASVCTGSNESLTVARLAFYAAYRIHAEWNTRLAEVSRHDWERIQRTYPLKEDEMFLSGQSWEEVIDRLRARLLQGGEPVPPFR